MLCCWIVDIFWMGFMYGEEICVLTKKGGLAAPWIECSGNTNGLG